MKSKDFILIY